jgi:putative FmdB family regulatory protein
MSKYSPFRLSQNKQLMNEWRRLEKRFFRELTVPIFEFQCNKHGVFESYSSLKEKPQTRPCPVCGKASPAVEYSIPAKRNPEHGIAS